jgi:hypothetical protein
LIDGTDIEDTMNIEERDYGFDSPVANQMSEFKDRYEPLALVINENFEVRDGKTIEDLFGSDAIVKKVPNQMIFFVS